MDHSEDSSTLMTMMTVLVAVGEMIVGVVMNDVDLRLPDRPVTLQRCQVDLKMSLLKSKRKWIYTNDQYTVFPSMCIDAHMHPKNLCFLFPSFRIYLSRSEAT